MSRRSRHGRHAHSHAPGRPPHHAAPAPERPAAPPDAAPKRPEPGIAAAIVAPPVVAAPAPQVVEPHAAAAPPVRATPAPDLPPVPSPAPPATETPAAAPIATVERPARIDGDPYAPRTTCTTAQLRRFIKSRPWVPLHELRRRFGISGDDDDVSPIRVGGQQLFVGLPPAEARMVGELLSGGDVGYELSLDPTAPIVVGVYPMRPVPRS